MSRIERVEVTAFTFVPAISHSPATLQRTNPDQDRTAARPCTDRPGVWVHHQWRFDQPRRADHHGFASSSWRSQAIRSSAGKLQTWWQRCHTRRQCLLFVAPKGLRS